MQGKTPIWGNPMRERFISQLQESTYQQQQYNFQPREKYLTAPKTIPKNSASIFVPRKWLYDPAEQHPKQCQICTVQTAQEPSSSPT
jgi:hypothetical protein